MKKLKKLLLITSVSLGLVAGLTGCANLSVPENFALNCLAAPEGKQQKYRITLKQAGAASDVQYLVVNKWLAGGLTSIGVNPVGVKLYFSTWQKDALKIEKNPAYSDIEFQSVLQGILLASPINDVADLCMLTEKNLDNNRQVFINNKLMFTYFPTQSTEQHFLSHNSQHHVLFEKL